MKKSYNFWLLPYNKFYQDENNPYSAITGSLKTAQEWCKELFFFNKDANAINFKSENGRKMYTIER